MKYTIAILSTYLLLITGCVSELAVTTPPLKDATGIVYNYREDLDGKSRWVPITPSLLEKKRPANPVTESTAGCSTAIRRLSPGTPASRSALVMRLFWRRTVRRAR